MKEALVYQSKNMICLLGIFYYFIVDVVSNNWKYEKHFLSFYIVHNYPIFLGRISWQSYFPYMNYTISLNWNLALILIGNYHDCMKVLHKVYKVFTLIVQVHLPHYTKGVQCYPLWSNLRLFTVWKTLLLFSLN